MLQLIEGVPEFEQRVLKAPKGKGAEAIELRGGQRILFKTRTGGGGRGLTGDLVVLDEAMILPEATVAALVPTMAARSIHGNPQLWYAGSAVDQQKHEHGLVFARVRTRGLANAARVAWFEWSVEGDNPDRVTEAVRHDPVSWAQANPGMGIRISAEHIENECNGALGPREFAVERLGIGDWPDPDAEPGDGISLEAWLGLVDAQSSMVGRVCLAIDVTPSRSHASIGAAGRRPDGLAHVEVVEHKAGTGWVVDRVAELKASHNPIAVVLDSAGPAAALLAQFADRNIDVQVVSATEHAQACGVLFDACAQARVRHLGTAELTAAIGGAVKRPLVDAWAWSRRNSNLDISPLVACTLALWRSEVGGSDLADNVW
jgi:hypothetical protein